MEENNFNVMKDLQGYFKEGQRKAIYDIAENPRDKVLIRLLWITGRRISEILNIKVHEIDFQINAISIHVEKKTTKLKDSNGKTVLNENGKAKKVKLDYISLSYIDDKTANILKYYISTNKLLTTDYLFKSNFNPVKPISRQRAFEIIKSCCNKVGIFKVGKDNPHPHHFRHSYAIDNAKNMKSPADVRKLQLAMNHSSLAVTEQYLKFNIKELKSMLDNIGD